MTDLAPHLSAFLKQYLPQERNFSRHTVQSYTDCFRLLVLDTAQQLKVRPCQLQIEHFTTAQVTDFLARLQHQRGNRRHQQYPPGGDQKLFSLPGISASVLLGTGLADPCDADETN